MAKFLQIRVDYSRVSVMARELAGASGRPYEYVLRLETASIIKICALNARIASLAKIKEAMIRRISGTFREPNGSSIIVINQRRDKGRTWFAYFENKEGGSRGSGRAGIRNVGAYMIFDAGPSDGWHVPDTVWHDYLALCGYREEALKRGLKERQRARGLQRLSWLQIGDALGVDLNTVSPSGSLQEALARRARPANGRTYRNGVATVYVSAAGFSITVRNSSPLAIKNQGQRQLDRAVHQRLRGFEIAWEKGVHNDFKLRAKRWRGIFVSP